jgi:hypothetical protein
MKGTTGLYVVVGLAIVGFIVYEIYKSHYAAVPGSGQQVASATTALLKSLNNPGQIANYPGEYET